MQAKSMNEHREIGIKVWCYLQITKMRRNQNTGKLISRCIYSKGIIIPIGHTILKL